MSSIPCTKAQVSQMIHGPNYTMAPQYPKHGEDCYCQDLPRHHIFPKRKWGGEKKRKRGRLNMVA